MNPSPSLPPWSREARAIVRLAAPLALTHLSYMAIMLTDVVMMGWTGTEAIAAGALARDFFSTRTPSAPAKGCACFRGPFDSRRHAVQTAPQEWRSFCEPCHNGAINDRQLRQTRSCLLPPRLKRCSMASGTLPVA